MAMLAFYAGLLIGGIAGMVLISLISMTREENRVQEASRTEVSSSPGWKDLRIGLGK